jgi:small subunit ribosomal protein S3
MLHAGNPAMELVDKGFAVAIKKLGVIGCRVRLIRPTVKLPGRFKIVEFTAPQESIPAAKKPEGIKELVKSAPVAKPEIKKPEIKKPEPHITKEAVPEEGHSGTIEERTHGDVLEHKHSEYDYWHPASRTHKQEE